MITSLHEKTKQKEMHQKSPQKETGGTAEKGAQYKDITLFDSAAIEKERNKVIGSIKMTKEKSTK